jgi:hypothetical protein
MEIQQKPNAPKRANAKERQRKALDYRIGGLTFQAIGEKLGVSKQAAIKLVEKALAELSAEVEKSADKLREIETARLDTVQAAIWGDVLKGDVQAVDRYIKISARRAALWGMDSPTKINLNELSDDEIKRALAIAETAKAPADDDSPTP